MPDLPYCFSCFVNQLIVNNVAKQNCEQKLDFISNDV